MPLTEGLSFLNFIDPEKYRCGRVRFKPQKNWSVKTESLGPGGGKSSLGRSSCALDLTWLRPPGRTPHTGDPQSRDQPLAAGGRVCAAMTALSFVTGSLLISYVNLTEDNGSKAQETRCLCSGHEPHIHATVRSALCCVWPAGAAQSDTQD